MIKRTLYFGNPAYLHLCNKQLIVRLPEVEKNDTLPDSFKKNATATIPIEDIGVIVLDDMQVTITQGLLGALMDNNTAVIISNETHHPSGLLLPLCVNTLQSERFQTQIEATEPLKKQLWQQTIIKKIKNQAAHLKARNVKIENMIHWADSVKSGDSENHEARAAAYYWANLFSHDLNFKREREGDPPNNILNYGYAILRATVARGLVSSGLMPTFGIHHHNRYNAYCLADDIMEPYRPYVDKIVCNIVDSGVNCKELNKTLKQELLIIPALDIVIDGENSPLMIGLQRTTSSLVKCYEGEQRKIIYPDFV